MSKVQIYYLSGTGNSLHAARELQKRIPGAELSPIASLVDEQSPKAAAQTVGFVFPIHYFTLPRVVGDFMNKLDLSAAQYLFAIGTRSGTPCNVFKDIDKILQKKGRKLDAAFLINMGDNNPRFKSFVDPAPEKIAELESMVMEELDSIQSIVSKRERSIKEDTTVLHPTSPALLNTMGVLTPLLTKKERTVFFNDDKCMGCGTCGRVCLSGKVKMNEEGKPVWQKGTPCYACFACINYCPMHAVQIKSMISLKSYTDSHDRYHHPEVTANDIAEQKL